MIDPQQVTPVLVTKGDGDISEVRESLEAAFGTRPLVWDNARHETDRKVYGRFLAAASAPTEYVYVQDDDCLIDAARLCREYDPQSGELLCNMLPGHRDAYARCWPGISLVGWGSIFPKHLIDFYPYLSKWPEDELFDRECDRVFTFLNRAKTRIVDIGVHHLESAHGKDRLSLDPRHGTYLMEIQHRLRTLERCAAA